MSTNAADEMTKFESVACSLEQAAIQYEAALLPHHAPALPVGYHRRARAAGDRWAACAVEIAQGRRNSDDLIDCGPVR